MSHKNFYVLEKTISLGFPSHFKILLFYFIIMFITDFCIFSHGGSGEKSAMARV